MQRRYGAKLPILRRTSLTRELTAIIICTPLTRLYLINYARPLIYTTFMSYPSLAAIRASYTFMASGETEQVVLYVPKLSKLTQIAGPVPVRLGGTPLQQSPEAPYALQLRSCAKANRCTVQVSRITNNCALHTPSKRACSILSTGRIRGSARCASDRTTWRGTSQGLSSCWQH